MNDVARVFRSIRAKLILWYSFVLLTTLVAFGLTTVMIVLLSICT